MYTALWAHGERWWVAGQCGPHSSDRSPGLPEPRPEPIDKSIAYAEGRRDQNRVVNFNIGRPNQSLRRDILGSYGRTRLFQSYRGRDRTRADLTGLSIPPHLANST
jgi:hypothetical protein